MTFITMTIKSSDSSCRYCSNDGERWTTPTATTTITTDITTDMLECP